MNQMGPDALSEWRPDLDRIIRSFQKKRRKALERCLAEGIGSKPDSLLPADKPDQVSDEVATIALQADWTVSTHLLNAFRSDLEIFQQQHIFQWSTFYRDCFEKHFFELLETANLAQEGSAADVAELLCEHTRSVFSQGYEHARGNLGRDQAIRKSLAGLAQFLELQLDFYTGRFTRVCDRQSAAGLRTLFSAATSGILVGYSKVRFGSQTGAAILPKYQRQWVHYLAFLTTGGVFQGEFVGVPRAATQCALHPHGSEPACPLRHARLLSAVRTCVRRGRWRV